MESLRLRASGVDVEVTFNGVPVSRDRVGEGLAVAMPLNLWWRPGRNVLGVDVRAVVTEGPGAVPVPPRPPSVFAAVLGPDESQPPLAALDWTLPRDAPFEPLAWRIPLSGGPSPTRVWDEAEPVEALSGGDRDELLRLGRRLHEAFAALRVDEVMTLLDWRFDEHARAVDVAPEVMKARARETYAKYLVPGWAPEPIVDAEVAIARGSDDGRLWTLERAGRSWIVTGAFAGPVGIGLDVRCAKVRGEWRVAR
jgi:hypothetical protein